MRYTVIFETQPASAGGGYHASCPALPGCHFPARGSEGVTLDEAVANICEAAKTGSVPVSLPL